MSGLFPRVPTFLDLNGPKLSFIEQPVDAETRDGSGIVSFVGIATATFPEDQLLKNENSGQNETSETQWSDVEHSETDEFKEFTPLSPIMLCLALSTATLASSSSKLLTARGG